MDVIRKEGSWCAALLSTEEETNDLLTVFRAVAAELEWQPGSFLNQSPVGALHFAALEAGVLAGGMQLVLPDCAGAFPYKTVWPEVKLPNAARLAHITILALAPEYRGHPALFWTLCVEMWHYSVRSQIEGIVMEATPPMLKLYRRMGWPLEVVGELRVHWGEPCYLCYMSTMSFAGSLVIKARRSAKYRELVAQLLRSEPSPICVAA